MQNLISQAAVDLIVAEEVSSKAAYEKHYRHPEWPGGASGITIGIGYDVGAGVKDRAQLIADWSGKIPTNMIDMLVPCIGVTGQRAHGMLEAVSGVDVPWDAAMAVFETVDIPRWYGICSRALPNFEMLSPDCKGALVSLAYNRGPSFAQDGDRAREMRAIKQHMIDKDFAKIPDEFRSMKRLWANTGQPGLLERRDREAALFDVGLKASVRVPPPVNPAPTPPIAKPIGIIGSIGLVIAGAAHAMGAHWLITATVVIAAITTALVFYLRKSGMTPGYTGR